MISQAELQQRLLAAAGRPPMPGPVPVQQKVTFPGPMPPPRPQSQYQKMLDLAGDPNVPEAIRTSATDTANRHAQLARKAQTDPNTYQSGGEVAEDAGVAKRTDRSGHPDAGKPTLGDVFGQGADILSGMGDPNKLAVAAANAGPADIRAGLEGLGNALGPPEPGTPEAEAWLAKQGAMGPQGPPGLGALLPGSPQPPPHSGYVPAYLRGDGPGQQFPIDPEIQPPAGFGGPLGSQKFPVQQSGLPGPEFPLTSSPADAPPIAPEKLGTQDFPLTDQGALKARAFGQPGWPGMENRLPGSPGALEKPTGAVPAYKRGVSQEFPINPDIKPPRDKSPYQRTKEWLAGDRASATESVNDARPGNNAAIYPPDPDLGGAPGIPVSKPANIPARIPGAPPSKDQRAAAAAGKPPGEWKMKDNATGPMGTVDTKASAPPGTPMSKPSIQVTELPPPTLAPPHDLFPTKQGADGAGGAKEPGAPSDIAAPKATNPLAWALIKGGAAMMASKQQFGQALGEAVGAGAEGYMEAQNIDFENLRKSEEMAQARNKEARETVKDVELGRLNAASEDFYRKGRLGVDQLAEARQLNLGGQEIGLKQDENAIRREQLKQQLALETQSLGIQRMNAGTAAARNSIDARMADIAARRADVDAEMAVPEDARALTALMQQAQAMDPSLKGNPKAAYAAAVAMFQQLNPAPANPYAMLGGLEGLGGQGMGIPNPGAMNAARPQ